MRNLIVSRCLGHCDPEPFGDLFTVCRIGLGKMSYLPLLNLFGHRAHGVDEIVNQLLFLVRTHHAVQVARLCIIVVALPVIVAIGVAGDLKRRLVFLAFFQS